MANYHPACWRRLVVDSHPAKRTLQAWDFSIWSESAITDLLLDVGQLLFLGS